MGTLGQKLDYLTDTKSILKQKINNLGGSLTDESTFRSYGDYLDELYDEMPKVTGEGTEITLTPTKKGRMQLDLKGNTSQASLPTGYTALDYIESTGTQYIDTGRLSTPNTKFEMDYLSNKEEGETFQCLFGSQNGDDSRRAYMLLGTSNIVTIHFPYSSGKHVLYMRTDGTFSNGSIADTVTINKEEKNKIIFDIPNKSVSVGQYTSVSTSADTLLGSNHSILILARNDNSAPTSHFATGKLYAFKWYENNKIVMDLIPCKNPNNEIGLYDIIGGTFFGNSGTGDFVAGNEITIPNPDYPQPIHVVTGNNTISIGNTNYPINLGSLELCKIGDYQDYFYKENGNWYTSKRINKYKLTSGFIDFGTIKNNVYRILTYQSSATITPALSEKNTILTACTHFVSLTRNQSDTGNLNGIALLNTSGFMINLPKDSDLSSVSAFKTFVDSNDVIIYYILATPIITQITDETLISQLDAIENAMSTTGTTTITQTNADLPFIISASALTTIASASNE